MGVQLMRVRHRPPNAQWPGEIIFFHKEYPDPGHGYPDDGRHCFSNWYPNLPFSDPEIDANVNLKQRLGIDPNTSIVFGTSEHYMMFWKALIYRNPRLAAEIISPANRNHPNVAKDLAKAAAEAAPAHDNLWRRINKDVVRRGCYLKFTSQDTSEELDYLLGTGKARLAESAPNDEFWGLKYDITNALPNQSRWGKNQLGEVLEDVRTCINTGAGCPPITWSSHI
ncbi:hypothetical protein BCR39DRAFT_174665 [Naematelia encephala]|uniref:NADAR domain-containing protein n=1 Tax=Naematelia encephala TaxID=71784 RepID=A0A1Y2B3P3_9TREE|nr:hypothetical protein BCR39DRAFT_174665 [Naematelia encephala]